jgi:dUTP pyrophosphatase
MMEFLLILAIGLCLIYAIRRIVNVIVEGHMADLRAEADARFRLPVKRLSQDSALPVYMSDSAAAADLFAADDVEIPPGMRALVKTGLAGAIPEGCAGFVCSRSGMALKKGVAVLNAPGVIDSDYRGEWGVILINLSRESFHVTAGMRVAQLIILPVQQYGFTEVEDLDETVRGSGGFGHTGD